MDGPWEKPGRVWPREHREELMHDEEAAEIRRRLQAGPLFGGNGVGSTPGPPGDLGWGPQFQERIVALLLREPERLAPFRDLLHAALGRDDKAGTPPVRILLNLFLDEWVQAGCPPSLDTFAESVREATARRKPAMAEQIRQAFTRLQALDIRDAAAVARRVTAWAKHEQAFAVCLRFANAVEVSQRSGRDPEIGPIREALQAIEAQGGEGAEPFPLLTVAEYLAADFGSQEFLVPDIGLVPGGAGALAGTGGVGKSLLLLGVATAWAHGQAPFAGSEALKPSRPLRVGMFPLEDPPPQVQKRLRKILGAERPAGLYIFPKQEAVLFGGLKGAPNQPAFDRLAAAIRQHRLDLVIAEPMVKMHQADENLATEMLRWLNPLRETCAAAGAAVFLATHTPHGEDRTRGSTSVPAWADVVLALTSTKQASGRTVHTLKSKKVNFAPDWTQELTLLLNAERLTFAAGERTATLCPPAALAAWVREAFSGLWEGRLSDFYQRAAAEFDCTERTVRESLKQAGDARLLHAVGRGQGATVRAAGVD